MIKTGHVDVVGNLLIEGVDVSSRDRDHFAPFYPGEGKMTLHLPS